MLLLRVPEEMPQMGMAWCNQETQLPLEVPTDILRMGVALCDQRFQILGVTRHIAGSIMGCYEWALVRPGRDYGIYHHSGAPEWML